MEKSRMNLPKGPDTLCFDKDEFMKVRPGGLRSPSRGGWPVFLSLRGLLQVLAVHASDQPPARPRCLCSESFGLSEKVNTVPGCDFLVNSVWPEIVPGLEEKLPTLFNPGDPDTFHQQHRQCHGQFGWAPWTAVVAAAVSAPGLLWLRAPATLQLPGLFWHLARLSFCASARLLGTAPCPARLSEAAAAPAPSSRGGGAPGHERHF
uniref:Uncharacterized protein n=1 Tax=Rangifer tarandus platyrhynchus TaxID=3082113 RepID=A0ACB0E7S5_RANTA|nr:unnamed protein product [Rangifer tarandus platyrhynchus]